MHSPTLPLRILAAVLCLLWALMALAVLIAYHPGGPVDVVVAAAAFLPAFIAASGVVWPPGFSDQRGLTALGWLAVVSVGLIVPSLVLLLQTLAAGGRQTLLPSPETAYAAALALGTTCVYVGLGIAQAAARLSSRRVLAGSAIGVVLTLVVAGIFGGAALANESWLRESTRGASIYGPVDPRLESPLCSAVPTEAAYARVELTGESQLDGRTVGTIGVAGIRAREAESWTSLRATPWATQPLAFVRVGPNAWTQEGGGEWQSVGRDVFGPAPAGTLDRAVRALIIESGGRAAAEDLGQELIGGARARHCRFLVDAPEALAGFVPLRWLAWPTPVTKPILAEWRGEFDYWIFTDGGIGMARVVVSGYAPDVWPGFGLQGSLRATLTATQRTEPVSVEQPIP